MRCGTPPRRRWKAADMPVRPAPRMATGVVLVGRRFIGASARRTLADGERDWRSGAERLKGNSRYSMTIARRKSVKVSGRVLYLTEDAELLKKQLKGEDLQFEPEKHAL